MQWFLCRIEATGRNKDLALQDNLCVTHPDKFGSADSDDWLIWLPSIPRSGDILAFSGWYMEVEEVRLELNFTTPNGFFSSDGDRPQIAATITVKD